MSRSTRSAGGAAPRCRRQRRVARAAGARTGRSDGAEFQPLSRRLSAVAGIGGAVLVSAILVIVFLSVYEQGRRSAFMATYPLPLADEWLGAGPKQEADPNCPGSGQRVCLVAIGSPPAADVDDLAAYLRSTYDLPVAVLPAIDLRTEERFTGELVDHERRQLDANAVLEVLKIHYPDAWQTSEVTLVALTAHDIFDSRNPDTRYWYGVRGLRPGRFTVVSSARMDDEAWGDDANETLLRIRTRKLVAREIGALHFGLSFSDDPFSVMTAVFGSRAGVDRASEFLPLSELSTRNRDLVIGARTWSGTGRQNTPIFEVEPGLWEYCAKIAGGTEEDPAHSGLRASLYTEEGVWVTAASGAGGRGALPCMPIAGADRYEVRLYTAPPALTWSVTVQPAGSFPAADSELPAWRTDFTTRFSPVAVDAEEVTFESLRNGWTPWFRPTGDRWEFCWELFEAPTQPAEVNDSNGSYFSLRLNLEHEVGDIGSWQFRDGEATDGSCVQVRNSQPNGRLWLFTEQSDARLGYRLVLRGVKLMP